jgi:mRNA interferase MazF
VVISQGEVWWAALPDTLGSELAIRRPVLVIQGDAFNQSAIRTVVCAAITSNLKWAEAPGNVVLPARTGGLARQSVVNVTQVLTLDKADLTRRVGKLSASRLELVLAGIDTMLGR